MAHLHDLKARLESLFGRSSHVDVQIYTPRELVSGYIKSAPGLNPLEAVWHTASATLESERIRLVHRLADNGIYFIAADAADFAGHPDSKSPLSAALPGAEGHQGDGAYFADIGAGTIAVVIKDANSLRCYVGDRAEVAQFANGYTAFWPDSLECDSWVGFRHLESRHAQRLATVFVAVCAVLTALFLMIAIAASWRYAVVSTRTDTAVNEIRAKEQKVAGELNAVQPDAFADYRSLLAPVLEKGGRLIHFESTVEKIKFETQFPSWVSSTDLGALGPNLSSKVEGDHIVVSKGL